MRRYAEADSARGPPAQPAYPAAKPGQALLQLSRVWSKHLLVGHPRAVRLGHRLNRRAGVAGIGDGGDARGKARGQTASGGLEIFRRAAGGLYLAKPTD